MSKKHLITVIFLTIATCSFCQSGQIYMSVAMPSNSILDSNTKSILKNKLFNMVSPQDVTAAECAPIAMVPDVNVISEEKVEGVMRTITTVELSVNISVRDILTDAVINTLQLSAKGNGYSVAEARRNAIQSIKEKSAVCLQFVNSTKERVVSYYEEKTSSLIAKANTLASMQQYDEALAILSAYPESLGGYEQVYDAMKSIFVKAQTKYCSQTILAARAALANRDFEGAGELASSIDVTSSCASEAKEVLNSVKQCQDKAYNDYIALEKQRISSNERLEKQRISSNERVATATVNAARDIATEYYKRQTTYIFWW